MSIATQPRDQFLLGPARLERQPTEPRESAEPTKCPPLRETLDALGAQVVRLFRLRN